MPGKVKREREKRLAMMFTRGSVPVWRKAHLIRGGEAEEED